MDSEHALRKVDPQNLVEARVHAHKAIQMLSRAALENLFHVPDYSHGSLAWDRSTGTFLTQAIPTRSGALQLGLRLDDLSLVFLRSGEIELTYPLHNVAGRDACAWLDERLEETGLRSVSGTELPYNLLPDVEGVACYESETLVSELAALSAWFDLADRTLTRFAAGNAEIHPGPSPVRCWPHHFDIATYVLLEEGQLDEARGVGVGLSPGDENYDQPYFYISPYPAPQQSVLPAPPSPGNWHQVGFVAAVATARDLFTGSSLEETADSFVERSFAIGRTVLGA